MSGSRLQLVRWLSARRREVGALVSVGIETPAGGMTVGKMLRSWSSGVHWDRDAGC